MLAPQGYFGFDDEFVIYIIYCLFDYYFISRIWILLDWLA